MKRVLFLDDMEERHNNAPKMYPDSYITHVWNVGDCLAHIMKQDTKFDIISLDHDLGEGMPTGYDLLNKLEYWVVNEKAHNFLPQIGFEIHSANPVGRENMKRVLRSMYSKALYHIQTREKAICKEMLKWE